MGAVTAVDYARTARRRMLRQPALSVQEPPPPLIQFVILSMLVHALVILLFGAPSGGSREGRAMWSTFRVILQGVAPEPEECDMSSQQAVAP